jgi:hypothetical protein
MHVPARTDAPTTAPTVDPHGLTTEDGVTTLDAETGVQLQEESA